MIKKCIPKVSVDTIIERIMAEIKLRKPSKFVEKDSNRTAPGPKQKTFEFKEKGYHINDFLKYDGQEFVSNAYRGILGREAEYEGLNTYMTHLLKGELTKTQILEALRYSPEGKAKDIPIRGIRLPYLIHSAYRLPGLGFLIQLMADIVQLTKTLRYLRSRIEILNHGKADQQALEVAIADSVSQNELRELAVNKADFSVVEQIREIKADRSEVDNLAAQKADIVAVEGMLNYKANRTEIKTLATQKADKTAVKELLSGKIDRSEFETKFAEKADASTVEELLSGKIDRSEFETKFAEKADVSTVEELLSDKVDRSEYETKLAQKADVSAIEKIYDANIERFEFNNLVELKTDSDKRMAVLQNENEQIRTSIREIHNQIRDHKLNILDQSHRLKLIIEEVRKRIPESFIKAGKLEALAKEEDHLLDIMYASLQDQFRGTRQEIKEKLKVYLDYIHKVKSGDEEFLLLDAGCGRGEWLELLKEEGISARGVDTNRVTVNQCVGYGLDVIEADAIDLLKSIPSASLGAVTAFHLIEHLPLTVLINFLDETTRVLKSGGIAIFETPNPENIFVSSYSFYLDPTHRHPLPCQMIEFLAEARGLCRLKIKYLHPYGQEYQLKEDKSELAERFQNLFYGPQDYALIGYKA
jgi:SAM-dependent methyltransferase